MDSEFSLLEEISTKKVVETKKRFYNSHYNRSNFMTVKPCNNKPYNKPYNKSKKSKNTTIRFIGDESISFRKEKDCNSIRHHSVG